MRIAIFTDTFVPQLNGVTIYLQILAAELEKRGNEVFIFAPRIKGYKDTSKNVIRIPSLKVISSEPEALLPVVFPSDAYKKMFEVKADLVHAHGNGAFSLLGYQVARIKGIPFILTFHNDHTKYTHYIFGGKIVTPKMVAYALRFFANISDGVTTPSLKMKKELKRYGFKRRVEVIPNFLDDSLFKVEKSNYLHKLLRINEKDKIVLSVGRLAKEKSFDFLIKSFKAVRQKNKDAHLVIVGRGPEKVSLANIAKNQDIEDSVHFTGQIPMEDMPKVYSSADIFATASLSEVHPISALEAAFSGLPLVVLSDDAFCGIVKNKVNGFVVKKSENALGKKILQLTLDEKLCEEFGNESRKIADTKFKVETVIGKQIAYYEKVIKEYKKKKKAIVIERTEILKATPSEVWKIIKDVSNYSRFIKFNLKSKLHSKFATGGTWSDWSIICWIPMKVHHEILKVIPNKRVVYLIRFVGGGLVFQDIAIRKVGEDTEIKIGVKITFGSRLSALFLRRMLEARTISMMEGSLVNVKKLVSKEDGK